MVHIHYHPGRRRGAKGRLDGVPERLCTIAQQGVLMAALALLTPPMGSAVAAPGDFWEVQQYSTNLRSGPGTDHGVYTQRGRGDVVMEVYREGDWLQVAIDSDGRTAWVHERLLEQITAEPGEAAPAPNFDNFASLFDPQDPDNQFGVPVYFREPVHLEYGVLRVDAHDGFLELDPDTRESHLRSLLRLWSTADNSGVPVTIIVRDPDTREHRYIRSDLRGDHVIGGSSE